MNRDIAGAGEGAAVSVVQAGDGGRGAAGDGLGSQPGGARLRLASQDENSVTRRRYGVKAICIM